VRWEIASEREKRSSVSFCATTVRQKKSCLHGWMRNFVRANTLPGIRCLLQGESVTFGIHRVILKVLMTGNRKPISSAHKEKSKRKVTQDDI
jgi:hypothetical protein